VDDMILTRAQCTSACGMVAQDCPGYGDYSCRPGDGDCPESCTQTYIVDGSKSAGANEWKPCLSIDCSLYEVHNTYAGQAGWITHEAARTNCNNWSDCVGYWKQTNGWFWAMDSNAWSARETAANSFGAWGKKDCILESLETETEVAADNVRLKMINAALEEALESLKLEG